MTPTEIRTAVRSLQAQGRSLREISRLLALSRNTVRRILREPLGKVAETPPCDDATLSRLKAAFTRARGNVVRVRELLAAGRRPVNGIWAVAGAAREAWLDGATVAVTALAAATGAWCVRVHQVPLNADAVRVAAAWRRAAAPVPDVTSTDAARRP